MFNVAELAERFQVSHRTIYRWTQLHLLPQPLRVAARGGLRWDESQILGFERDRRRLVDALAATDAANEGQRALSDEPGPGGGLSPFKTETLKEILGRRAAAGQGLTCDEIKELLSFLQG